MKFYEKRKRSAKERVGFYTALSICMVAVGMAAYSTYSSISSESGKASAERPKIAVERVVTGVTETEPESTAAASSTAPVTETTATEPVTEYIEETTPAETKTALETMLTVNTSLSFPLDKCNIIAPYSEKTVYNKTLNEWKAHTGVDFVVKSPTYTAYYSGLKDALVSRGNTVKTGEQIATAGTVPSEKAEDNHIHIAIKVEGQYVDPLELIKSNE